MGIPTGRHGILMASNRGPVSFTRGDDGQLSAKRGGGGDVSGLASVSGQGGGRAVGEGWHVALVEWMVAELRPSVRIAHFSHTPWAPVDYFRLLPDAVAREVLDGILGADHAGFLCQRWADAFLDCCEQVLGATVDRDRQLVTHRGHETGIGVHPLGVDAPELISRAAEPDVAV